MDENRSSLIAPIAIVICILIIAGAFYYQSQRPASDQPTSSVSEELGQILTIAKDINLAKFRPIDSTDKIRGSVEAPIKLVVYTDLECPACKYFHQQLEIVEAEYVTTGSVAIVYRNFPLDSLHPKSRAEHLATECVNEIGGLDKYWQFVDKIFEITPSNNGLDLAKLNEVAQTLGIDTEVFESCLATKKYASEIQASVDEAIALGVPGTPFFVLVTPDQNIPVFGGVPAENLSAALDLLLAETSSPVATSTVSN